MAIILREVEHSDFNELCALFLEAYGKEPSKGFKKAFYSHNALLGFCLVDDEIESLNMVGYFGCFTYKRNIEDKIYKFYNLHTWIVKSDYRKQSLKLLLPYIRLKDGVVTNFSANGKVAQILEQLKFTKINLSNYVLKQGLSIKSYAAQRQIKRLPLSTAVAKEHEPFECLCINLQLDNTNLELILKAIDKKPKWVKNINKLVKTIFKKPLITKSYFIYKVHYANNHDLLLKNLSTISHYLLLKEKVGGIVVSERLAKEMPLKKISLNYEDEIFIKGNNYKLPKIDYLYSEVFYLNISDK